MPRFSGTIRVDSNVAKLETSQGDWLSLNPYPADAPLALKAKLATGKQLFGYLEGHEISVSGKQAGDLIDGAHLIVADEIQGPAKAVGAKAAFANELSLYFTVKTKQIAAKLNVLGIRSLAALYHRIRNSYEQESAAFSKYLKTPTAQLDSFLQKLREAPDKRGLVSASPRYPVRGGINLKAIAQMLGVPAKTKAASPPSGNPLPATPDLPLKVDLTAYATPVKNQGFRSTCVAHTALACLEAEYVKAGKAKPSLDLSEQYLYWACKEIDKRRNDEGTFLKFAADVLLKGVPAQEFLQGVCPEKKWPYNALPKDKNESQGPPPAELRNGPKKWKHRAEVSAPVKHNSIRGIKEALQKGRFVGLSVYTYHFWTDDYAWREGVISLPLGTPPDGAHAIALVGYRDDDNTHRDGYFFFKNSWDRTWGHGRPDPGYGSLPYRYVLKEAIEAYTFEI